MKLAVFVVNLLYIFIVVLCLEFTDWANRCACWGHSWNSFGARKVALLPPLCRYMRIVGAEWNCWWRATPPLPRNRPRLSAHLGRVPRDVPVRVPLSVYGTPSEIYGDGKPALDLPHRRELL